MYQSKETLDATAAQVWSDLQAQAATGPLTAKQRITIPAQEMPAMDPGLRSKTMDEVALGYSPTQARVEASRCLDCKTAPCVTGCPVGINIPGFVKEIEAGNFASALGIIQESSLLPAICGRVCPQESQCQEPCTLGKSLKDRNKAVAIGRLERFVADWAREEGVIPKPLVQAPSGHKVAIVGSGPAGIAAAADLAKAGHRVEIFEAFHKPGGVMVYGIPEFRLPKAIVEQEINALKELGVTITTNFLVGRTRKLQDLLDQDGFSAVFIGSGAGLPRFMGIEGEHLVGVFAANEYLTRSNLMKAYAKGQAATPLYQSKRVAVLGGGNVAMDAARTALRLGAEHVMVMYRRTEAQMPARLEEIAHAKEEGIEFRFLTNAVRVLGDEKERVVALDCVSYELGEPDASGRRSPVEIPNSQHQVPVDTVIVAIGNDSNPLLGQTSPGLDLDKQGRIVADKEGRTSIPGVWAGGDIVLGAATVILAMGEGRAAASSINQYILGLHAPV